MSAVDTLRPGSNPDTSNPKSKFEILKDVLGALADVDQSDTNLSRKVQDAVVAAGRAGPDLSAFNLDTVKGRVKAHTKDAVKEMFAEQELSEEFKERATNIFAEALEARLQFELVRLEEETAETIDLYESELEKHIIDTISGHLDACCKAWLQENRVAIDHLLQTDNTNESMNESVAPPRMKLYAAGISRLAR